jgi:hypothetical protein
MAASIIESIELGCERNLLRVLVNLTEPMIFFSYQ